VAGLVVFVLFAAFGLFLAAVGAREFFVQRQVLAAATPVEATITRSEVASSRSADTDRRTLRDTSTTSHTPEVEFTYEVNGVQYTSDLLGPSKIVRGYASADGAAEELRPYPVGAKVTAFVDPTRPERAFLGNEPSVAPHVFMLVGLLLVPVAWFASRLV
jgi:hypothetical protein